MSAIKDGRIPIMLDKERHVLFSLNVIDEVEEKIGDLNNLEEEMNKPGRMKLIKWLFARLLNEGAAYTKYLETKSTEGAEALSESEVGILINGTNMAKVTELIFKSLNPHTDTEGNEDDHDHDHDEEGNEGPDKKR